VDKAIADRADALRSSARLGLTIRSLLLSPSEGFASATRAADRRRRAGRRIAEGTTPYLLAALGGAGVMAMWLKVGALAGLREPALDFRSSYLAVALIVGAVMGLISVVSFGGVAARVIGTASATPSNMRLAAGLAALPHVLTVVFLVPLDLLIVGPEMFTTQRLADPLATAWAAFSIAVGVAMTMWSVALFVLGVRVVSDGGPARTVTAAVIGIVISFGLVAALVVAARVMP
jgi:hypothetical protein